MSEQQEYIIKKLTETGEQALTESLYKALVEALKDQFNLRANEARKIVINTLRGLYAQ